MSHSVVGERRRAKIIMDTNALFVPFQFRIEIFGELERLLGRNLELILLPHVKRELITLTKKRSLLTRKKAEQALRLAEKCEYIETDSLASQKADDAIVSAAKDWKAAVFTNDRQLRKRLRDISVPVIYVRQKSRLEIDGMI